MDPSNSYVRGFKPFKITSSSILTAGESSFASITSRELGIEPNLGMPPENIPSPTFDGTIPSYSIGEDDEIDGLYSSPTDDSQVWVLVTSLVFFLCILMWCIAAMDSCRSARRVQSVQEAKELPAKKRKELILAAFEKNGNQMPITREKWIKREVESQIESQLDKDIESPASDEGNVGLACSDGKQRDVEDGCAICMEPFQEDETVVWSCTESCPHMYHRECFVEYLLSYKGDQDEGPCPTCRQEFIRRNEEVAPEATKNLFVWVIGHVLY